MHMYINVQHKLSAFSLPNFLNDGQIDVGRLSEKEARQYWNEMMKHWLAHVKKRSQELED